MIELSVLTFVALITLSVVGALFLLAIVVGLLIGAAIKRGKRQEEEAKLARLLRDTGLK